MVVARLFLRTFPPYALIALLCHLVSDKNTPEVLPLSLSLCPYICLSLPLSLSAVEGYLAHSKM